MSNYSLPNVTGAFALLISSPVIVHLTVHFTAQTVTSASSASRVTFIERIVLDVERGVRRVRPLKFQTAVVIFRKTIELHKVHVPYA